MVNVDVVGEAVEPADGVGVTIERDTDGPADAVDEVTSVVYELKWELMKVTGQMVVDTASVEVTTATDV